MVYLKYSLHLFDLSINEDNYIDLFPKDKICYESKNVIIKSKFNNHDKNLINHEEEDENEIHQLDYFFLIGDFDTIEDLFKIGYERFFCSCVLAYWSFIKYKINIKKYFYIRLNFNRIYKKAKKTIYCREVFPSKIYYTSDFDTSDSDTSDFNINQLDKELSDYKIKWKDAITDEILYP